MTRHGQQDPGAPGTPERPAAEAAGPTGRDAPGRIPYLGVFGLMLGMFLAALDGQIVSAALPTVVGELGGLDVLSWVVTAYLLTTAAVTPLWGKLADLYGRKGTFQAAVVVFMAGSLLCGMAQDMGQLIAFRALQGVGAGGLMVGAIATIGVLVPPRDRGKVQSMVGVMMPIAFVGGPLLGGFLTDELSWRWAFYVNMPIGVAALLAVGAGVRLRTERIKARLDAAGATLLPLAVLALTLLGSWAGTTYSWGSPQVLGLAAVAVALLVWFVRVELRAPEPVVPPRLFGNRNFTVAQILSFLVGAVMMTVINYLPQYMQYVQGASPAASGMLLLPLMLGMVAAQITVGKYVGKGGRDRLWPVAGGAVSLAGVLLMLLLGTDTPLALASALTLVSGVGIGLLMQSATLITIDSTAARDMGAGTGTVTLVRTVGGSLGVAALGAVYAGTMSASLTDSLGGKAAAGMTGGGELTPALLREMPERARQAVGEATVSGMHGMLLGVTALAALAFAAAWMMRDTPAPDREAETGAGPASPEREEAAPAS